MAVVLGYEAIAQVATTATPISRQMSLQFAVAAALVDGRLEPSRYEGPIESRLAELAARTRVVVGQAGAVSSERVDLAPAGVLDKFPGKAIRCAPRS
ncbi:hypothetical protein [Nocardia carnea]|uniref:hypothetical protein n=1 Tax=Nocardia carnea TaxID=37328 RepID=UPI0024562CBB|nr:hypothetical protein [Nocardia carnea]